jgi:hypothetical protein
MAGREKKGTGVRAWALKRRYNCPAPSVTGYQPDPCEVFREDTMNAPFLRSPLAFVTALFFCALGCKPSQEAAKPALSPSEARSIAKEAFLYGFPMVANYQTMYKQAIDTGNKDYRAPFNTLSSAKSVATPEDKFVVTPNSDTPYSYLWMDLRAEPMVVTMPQIEANRYYTGQMVDLYTYNFAYLGTRSYGNDGGVFLIAGPDWKGEKPLGVKAVLRSETQLAYLLFRTQLFNTADLAKVNNIQDGYKAQTLSAFLKQPSPAAAPPVNWPKIGDLPQGAEVFPYVDFLFQFCPPNSTESALLARFARIGVGPGQAFDISKFSPEVQQAINEGIQDANKEFEGVIHEVNTNPKMNSAAFFGTREAMKDNYLYRYTGAKMGLYGNSAADAMYFGIFADANHQPLDASKSDYEFRFAKGELPPAKAFWSLTMYDGKTQLLVENPLKRYLLNSTTLKSYRYGNDGSLALYISHKNPGSAKQSNWLPAPNGPFYAVLRLYMPDPAVANGTWLKPQMQPVGR